MVQNIQIIILGLALGGVYALMASGLTLIFGVMGIVNLSHSAFMIVGAFIAFYAFTLFGIDPILSIVITMPAMFLLGIVVYKLIFARSFADPAKRSVMVLMTFALALVIEGTLGFFFSNIYRSTSPSYASDAVIVGPFFLPLGQLYAMAMSIVILLLLWAYLKYTWTGYAIRATMHNRTAAEVVGVNVDRISMLVFGIGMALAGASGSALSFVFSFYPSKHWEFVAILLSLVVLGGMGSLLGALIGALSLSVVAAFVSSNYGPTWSPVTFYLALFIILLVRPQGLLGKKSGL
ncbi:branched-chain amino acid ABC transporter permease [Roseisalinus antarcticus]|uniref:High-affinity branched-chain amino acid transport system permease protein LivH n=1 Tax=Roseisalinus antarcticus TaxID=254357 RepID=A0A1Y5U0A6_9RHOB|nr:branched-chain amino acid ABC transporter permease [Roseisalinus antarcticus]SLN77929.1 High-affinity branched-chain amino acid transport system permease protein LivH [Roseisalinus antarcticus]